jgi:hypothetical protein
MRTNKQYEYSAKAVFYGMIIGIIVLFVAIITS